MTTPAPTRDGAADANKLSTTEEVAKAALQLRTHGWAVVPDVIRAAECSAYTDRVWGWLENLGTGIKRNDPSTWVDDKWPPQFLKSGITGRLEVAHQDFVWALRSDPRVTSIFAALWGTDALLSSFDSINIMRPTSVTDPGVDFSQQPPSGWWHTDQRPSKPGLECVQGLLNLSEVGPHAGTLMVKEGSHLAHETFWSRVSHLEEDQKAVLGDFYRFAPEELAFWEQFPSKALTGFGPGSLFLWDSRTVHQNRAPTDPTLWRHVLYTCYQPAALASPADLDAKREAYEQYRATTHWPAKNIAAGASNSEEEERKFVILRNRRRVENNTILRLAGVKPYDPATERRCKPLLQAGTQELQALLVAHQVAKAQQLAEHAQRLALATQAAAAHDAVAASQQRADAAEAGLLEASPGSQPSTPKSGSLDGAAVDQAAAAGQPEP